MTDPADRDPWTKGTIAWAGSQSGRPPPAWSVQPTRRQAVEQISKALPADDYARLDRAKRWRLARKHGWRLVKVEIRRVGR